MRHGGLFAAILAALIAAGCGGGAGRSGSPVAAPPAGVATDPTAAPSTTATAAASAAASAASTTPTATAPTSSQSPTATTTAARRTPSAVAAAATGTPPPAHPIPVSFGASGISPGAPSDAQVRAELQQMYVAQAHARKLTADAANFAALLPWVQERKTGEMVSVASVFVDYGLGLACGGVLAVNQIGVAHKTAPCGTLIDFTFNGRTLRVPVIDRGPYIVGREWDLTGAAAQALGFPGLGRIIWRCASC